MELDGSWRMEARRRVALAQQRRLVASIPTLPPPPAPNTGEHGSGPQRLSLLVFGESTAAGIGVPSHREALVGQLAAHLCEPGFAVNWQVLAAGGLTAQTARARLLPRLVDEYDLAVAILGVNDMFAGTELAAWRRDVTAILAALHQRRSEAAKAAGRSAGRLDGGSSIAGPDERYPASGVVVAGVPPIESFPRLRDPLRSVLAAHRSGLDDVLRELATAEGLRYVPTPRLTHPGDLAPDRFHPSAQGYRRWADVLTAAIRAAPD